MSSTVAWTVLPYVVQGGASVISHSGDGVPSIPGKRKSAPEEESIESFALEAKRLRASVTL